MLIALFVLELHLKPLRTSRAVLIVLVKEEMTSLAPSLLLPGAGPLLSAQLWRTSPSTTDSIDKQEKSSYPYNYDSQ